MFSPFWALCYSLSGGPWYSAVMPYLQVQNTKTDSLFNLTAFLKKKTKVEQIQQNKKVLFHFTNVLCSSITTE